MARSRNARLIESRIGEDLSGLAAAVRSVPVLRRHERTMAREMRGVFRRVLTEAMEAARRDGSMPYRTGRGYNSVMRGIRVFGDSISNLRGHIIAASYMAAHNEGAQIRPRNAKALAIPLEAALRGDGTPKLPGPNSWRIHGSFMFRSKRTGKGYIARKDGAGNLILLYALVSFVELRKYRGWADSAWERELPGLISEMGNVVLGYLTVDEVLRAFDRGHSGG